MDAASMIFVPLGGTWAIRRGEPVAWISLLLVSVLKVFTVLSSAYDHGMAMTLVIDTCGDGGYVAVVAVDGADTSTEGEAVSERRLAVRATQEELLPAVEAVLAQARLELRSVSAIAVVSGPGSFTGVRIGLATAKGLCEAADLPLVSLSRLAVLANATNARPVWAWLQAGRGDVYAEFFPGSTVAAEQQAMPDPAPTLTEGAVYSMEQAVAVAGSDPVVICEESLCASAPEARLISDEEFRRSLRASAIAAVRKGRTADTALADAVYLRVPDAELALRASRA